MSSKKSVPTRVDNNFLEQLRQLQLARIKYGKDNPLKPIKISRLTLAMTRHSLFPKIKEDIIKADLI